MPRIRRKNRRNKKTEHKEYTLTGPKTIEQKITRDIFNAINKHMDIPHCVICGDTEKDGGMEKVEGVYFCETCFMIQTNME